MISKVWYPSTPSVPNAISMVLVMFGFAVHRPVCRRGANPVNPAVGDRVMARSRQM